MPPKKKGGIKEPDVVVPAGDPKIGKGIFDELCASCHGLDVLDGWFREMAREQLHLLWEEWSAGKQERLSSLIAKPWRDLESPGAISISGCILPTLVSMYPATKCHSQDLPERLTRPTSSPSSQTRDRRHHNHIFNNYKNYKTTPFSLFLHVFPKESLYLCAHRLKLWVFLSPFCVQKNQQEMRSTMRSISCIPIEIQKWATYPIINWFFEY